MPVKYIGFLFALVFSLASCGQDAASNNSENSNIVGDPSLSEGEDLDQGQGESQETAVAPQPSTNVFAQAVNLVTDLPVCSSDIYGKVIYVSSENIFYHCEDAEWLGIPTATQTYLYANYSCTGFVDVLNPFAAASGTNAYNMNSKVNFISIQVLTDGTIDILAKEMLYDINDEFMDFATTPYKFYPVQQTTTVSSDPVSADALYENGSTADGSSFPESVSSFAGSQDDFLFTISGTYYYFVGYLEGGSLKIKAFNAFVPDSTEFNNQQIVTCDTIYKR